MSTCFKSKLQRGFRFFENALDRKEKELLGKKDASPYLSVINNKVATGTLSHLTGVVQEITGWQTNQFIRYIIYHITVLGAALHNITWFKTY